MSTSSKKASLSSQARDAEQQAQADDASIETYSAAVRLEMQDTKYYLVGMTLKSPLALLTQLITGDMERQGFWQSANTGEKIALMHSELSEALEADRKGIEADDKIPEFTGVEAELADTIIRILDFAGYYDLRLCEAIIAKCQYNLTRQYQHGKAY